MPEQRTGKARLFELQKLSIPDTAQIFREVQRQKYKTFIMANSIIGRLSHCNHRIAVTLCNLETLFPVYVVIITLYG